MLHFFALLFCCLPIALVAQPSLQKLKQIPLKHPLKYHRFFYEEGSYSLLVKEEHEVGENPILRYYQLSQDLEVEQQSFYPLDSSTEVVLAEENMKSIYILLKKEKSDHELLILDKRTSDFEVPNIALPASIQVSHLLATNKALFIGGKIKEKTTAYKLPLNSDKFQVLFYHLNQSSNLRALQHHKKSNTVSFLMETCGVSGMAIKFFLINQYYEDGTLMHNARVPTPINYRICEAKLLVLNRKNSMLVGTYSQAVFAKDNIVGFFSINLQEKDIVDTRFYDLSKVEHYFAYLSDKKADNLKKRISKAADKGRSIKTRLAIELSDLELKENKILLTGSSFHKIKNSDKTYSFEYLNSFITCFDAKGRLLWNNTLTYPKQQLITPSPFMLTEASMIDGQVFFIQKQQYIYRTMKAQQGTRYAKVQETYLNDGFLSVEEKNMFYEQHMDLLPNGQLLYFGIREQTLLNNIFNSQTYFFVEQIEALPQQLFSKGEN